MNSLGHLHDNAQSFFAVQKSRSGKCGLNAYRSAWPRRFRSKLATNLELVHFAGMRAIEGWSPKQNARQYLLARMRSPVRGEHLLKQKVVVLPKIS
jgi:hypothetical protein